MTLYRFDQIADNITVRVEPSDTDLERYVGLEHLDPESLKLRRWGSPADVIGQKLKFWKGDIIYGKRRAYQRKLAVADFDGICSAHAMVLRAKQDVILPELLPFFLQSEIFHQRAMEISVGSLSPTINWSALAKQEFPLPPVDEQLRIADLLWAADDAILKQDELVSQALITKKSFIDKIFSNNELKEIGDFAESVTSGSRWWAKHYSDSGDIFIRVANLTRETTKIDLSDLQYVTPPEGAEMERTRLKTGDLLISVTADLGRIGVVSDDFPRAFMSQHVAQVRLQKDKVIPEFVAYSLLSSSGQKQFRKMNDAGAKAGMNLQTVRKLKFSWQSLEEQTKTMEMLKSFEETIELARQHLDNQKQLKKQLLSKSLSA